jgi:beta-galactosidase
LTPIAGNNQVSLSWTPVSGATGYDVYRGTTSGGETLLSTGTNVSASAFTDTTAASGTQYFYYVTALNGSLQSGKSNEVSATPQAPLTGSLVLAISAGGPAAGSFVADTDFSGGTVSGGTKATIKTSGVTNPPPQSVLQHGRYGNLTYTIPNLTAGASYVVRLDFVEYAFNAAGSRVFNVAINGTQVLSNFDIWSAAGGENIAIVKLFTATASSTGTITIGFTSVVNNSMINGIEIYTPTAPANPAVVPAGSPRASMDLAFSSPGPPTAGLPATEVSNSPALDAVFTEWGRPGLHSLISGLPVSAITRLPDKLSPPSGPTRRAIAPDDLLEFGPSLFVRDSTSF